jgi:hypothetical protein
MEPNEDELDTFVPPILEDKDGSDYDPDQERRRTHGGQSKRRTRTQRRTQARAAPAADTAAAEPTVSTLRVVTRLATQLNPIIESRTSNPPLAQPEPQSHRANMSGPRFNTEDVPVPAIGKIYDNDNPWHTAQYVRIGNQCRVPENRIFTEDIGEGQGRVLQRTNIGTVVILSTDPDIYQYVYIQQQDLSQYPVVGGYCPPPLPTAGQAQTGVASDDGPGHSAGNEGSGVQAGIGVHVQGAGNGGQVHATGNVRNAPLAGIGEPVLPTGSGVSVRQTRSGGPVHQTGNGGSANQADNGGPARQAGNGGPDIATANQGPGSNANTNE